MRVCITCGSDKLKWQWYAGPTCGECFHKQNYGKTRTNLRGRFNRSKSIKPSRRKRGITWSLSYEEWAALIHKGCTYCGVELLSETGSSMDRIDGDAGYSPENVVPCCGNCNAMRGSHISVAEMKHLMLCLQNYRATA